MIPSSSKQIVLDTVMFRSPGRLARDLWLLPAAIKAHGDLISSLQAQYPSDFAGDGFEDQMGGIRLYVEGAFTDPWGSGWINHTPGLLGQVRSFPLNDWDNLRNYPPPYHLVGKGFEKVPETLAATPEKFHLGGIPPLFHRICWLRDPSLAFMDFYTSLDEILTVRDMVHEYNMRHLKELLKYHHDGIIMGDDWGAQSQLLIRPAIWREYFKPCYKEYFDLVRGQGRLAFFHSDGYILEIIEDLIEIGVQVLNCQVACMGVEELGRRFAGRICFWGELDRQHLLPRGAPEDIILAAKKNLKYLSTPEGGYIMQAELNADVPVDNIAAFFETYNLIRSNLDL